MGTSAGGVRCPRGSLESLQSAEEIRSGNLWFELAPETGRFVKPWLKPGSAESERARAIGDVFEVFPTERPDDTDILPDTEARPRY